MKKDEHQQQQQKNNRIIASYARVRKINYSFFVPSFFFRLILKFIESVRSTLDLDSFDTSVMYLFDCVSIWFQSYCRLNWRVPSIRHQVTSNKHLFVTDQFQQIPNSMTIWMFFFSFLLFQKWIFLYKFSVFV